MSHATTNSTSGSDQTSLSTGATQAQPVTAPTDFSAQAEEAQPSLLAEFLDFLVNNKAWWLTPIILVLAMVGILVVLGSTPAGPFIYTFF